jgi:hypothetical protein
MEIVLVSLVLYNTMYIGSTCTLVQQKVYFSNDVDFFLSECDTEELPTEIIRKAVSLIDRFDCRISCCT